MSKEEIKQQTETLQEKPAEIKASEEHVQDKEPDAETVAYVKGLNPIDDIFFNKMGESPEVDEEIISTILQVPVKVLKVIPQNTIASLQGRGVRLDALADVIVPGIQVKAELLKDCPIGEKGAKINIEVQKDDNDDHQKRVLFNAAAVMLNETPKGTKKFKDVPDVVVIFISKFDVFKKGRMFYEVERTLKGLDEAVYNGMREYYVNAAIKDRSTEGMADITDLMEIFVESDRYDYKKFPKISERKHQFKNTEEGVKAMSDGLQELLDKKAKEQEQATTISHIKDIMENLKLSLDQAMDALRIPQGQRSTYDGLIKNS